MACVGAENGLVMTVTADRLLPYQFISYRKVK